MLFFRWAILFLLLLAGASFLIFVATGDSRYKAFGLKTLKWTLMAAFGFFAVLILERIA